MATVIPIFRIFDYEKALEFYVKWLGFHVDWQHKEAGFPIYIQISLRDITLHLTEHHGDCSPGARVFIDRFTELEKFQEELLNKGYIYNRPRIEKPSYDKNAKEMTVIDPFGNRLSFTERNDQSQTNRKEVG